MATEMSRAEAILAAIDKTDKLLNENLSKGTYSNNFVSDSLVAQRNWLLSKLIEAGKEQKCQTQ